MFIKKFCDLNNFTAKSISSKGLKIHGFATVYNRPDYMNDVILPNSLYFSSSVSKKSNDSLSIKMLSEHNNDVSPGYWTKCEEKEFGLWVEGVVTDTFTIKKITSKNIGQPILCGLSIGFYLKKYFLKDGYRYIELGDLHEVSLVANPANQVAAFTPQIFEPIYS